MRGRKRHGKARDPDRKQRAPDHGPNSEQAGANEGAASLPSTRLDLAAYVRDWAGTPEGRQRIAAVLTGGSDDALLRLLEMGFGKAKMSIEVQGDLPALPVEFDALPDSAREVLCLILARTSRLGVAGAVAVDDRGAEPAPEARRLPEPDLEF